MWTFMGILIIVSNTQFRDPLEAELERRPSWNPSAASGGTLPLPSSLPEWVLAPVKPLYP
jgi:hypothetical protein